MTCWNEARRVGNGREHKQEERVQGKPLKTTKTIKTCVLRSRSVGWHSSSQDSFGKFLMKLF